MRKRRNRAARTKEKITKKTTEAKIEKCTVNNVKEEDRRYGKSEKERRRKGKY